MEWVAIPWSKWLLISGLHSLSAKILEPKKTKSVTACIFCPAICHEVMELDAKILTFECWVSSQLFHSPLSPSFRCFLVPLHFLPLHCLLESEVLQSCLTLWDPMDCSLPGSSVHLLIQCLITEHLIVSWKLQKILAGWGELCEKVTNTKESLFFCSTDYQFMVMLKKTTVFAYQRHNLFLIPVLQKIDGSAKKN